MTAYSQSITKCVFTATINLGGVVPISESILLSLPLTFASAKNIQVLNGQYTPNNDYLYLANGFAADKAPNFFFLLCDSPISITCTFPRNNASHAHNRFGFLSWADDPVNTITSMFIDGRVSPNPGVSTMAQGVPVNYTFVFGQAAIS